MSKLHLGCGKRDFGNDWIHIDQEPWPHVDYICGANQLPVEEFDDVKLIYASHILEYFDRAKALEVLKHWYDILEPGGILRLAVPDFEEMMAAYIFDECSLDQLVGPLYGKMQSANTTIYHKTTYDFVSLEQLLLKAGFTSVQRYDWRKTEHADIDDHSQAYLPHMDKENGRLISLNVEATK